MALMSILRDFAVRAGLIVEGTNAVTSSTGMTGTLQVNGGAAIAKNLIVGTTVDVGNTATVNGDLFVFGKSNLSTVETSGSITVNTNTQATTLGAGAVSITGGAYLGNNLVVNGNASNTSTVTGNALYVNGGAGIKGSLLVQGDAVFQKDVIFAGTTTYVYSTNTVYTDNFIDLHVPSDSSLTWSIDDGKDIGLIFNYYNGANADGFLGIKNDTKFLEWYSNGAEVNGTFTNVVYGTFKTGSIKLVDTTSSTNTTSGALTVSGGAGVGGNLYVGGDLSAGSVTASNLTQGRVVIVGANGKLIDDAELLYDPNTNQLTANISSSNTTTNIAGGTSGALIYQTAPGTTGFIPIGAAGLLLVSDGSKPIWTTTGTIVAGAAFTATNIFFGQQYQVPFQTGPGSTSFEDNFKYNYDTDTFITVNATFTGTTDSTSASSGGVQMSGGLGVAKNLNVGQSGSFAGNIFVNGGVLATTQTTFDLINTTATTVNFAGAATALSIGSTSGTTDIKNDTIVSKFTVASSTASGALQVRGGAGVGGNLYVGGIFDVAGNSIQSNSATFNLLNANVTTLNLAGAGTAVTIGSTAGYTAIRNLTTLTNTTNSLSTNSGALQVYGGAGIGGNLYVGGTSNITGNVTLSGDLAVNGGDITSTNSTFSIANTTATTVNFAGEATTITIGSNSAGTTTVRNILSVSTNTESSASSNGALVVTGGVGVGGNVHVGGNVVTTGDLEVNGGDITTNQSTFNLVNTTATTVNFAGQGTTITIGAQTGSTTVRNQFNVTSSTIATSAASGALVVTGGIGVSQNVWVGTTLRVQGATTLANLDAQVTTSTFLTVTNDANVQGILTANSSQNSNATTNGALRVTGGVGVVKDVFVGGAITVGATAAATTATVVPALYSNNLLLSSYTASAISGSTLVGLDSFSSAVYRSARYFVQIVDGSSVHISEISLFHDGVKAYINEYGIATNNGQLGSFDASLSGGNVTVNFTPTLATNMTIKMVRIGVTL